MTSNLILLTDSYKVSHAKQYNAGTEQIYSYFESRGGEFEDTVFFGLQYFLKKYLEPGITRQDIEEAADVYGKHLGPAAFNREGWEYILNQHGGKLPVKIRAVPEGMVIPNRNVLMTIENTDPKLYWLTNYLETLLVQVWYPSTVATISREMKKTLKSYLEKTADSVDGLGFKLHDFGCRGVSSMESAGVGGAGHLVNFLGTDTVPALMIARQFYGTDMAGFSIPAAEHSTITSWGKDHELDAYNNMLEQFPTGLVAVVSDSWDIDRACKVLWGQQLKDKVMKRNGVVVIRPDSGDPTVVLPRLLNILGSEFGSYHNKKDYKMLPDKVRLIQGDGITRQSLQTILDAVVNAGWSTDNLAFGSGGGLLQSSNRDTLKFAFKCSSTVINGEERDVYKNPATAAWKASKAGRLALVRDSILGYRTVREHEATEDVLVEVFNNGQLTRFSSLEDIRKRAAL